MIIVDDFLPKAYQDMVEEMMFGENFPWYLNKSTTLTFPFGKANTTDGSQFTHMFVEKNNIVSDSYTLLELTRRHIAQTQGVHTGEILRVKANLNTPQANYPVDHHYVIHTDTEEENAITCLYYVNDCDGDTVFFDRSSLKEVDRVTPKKGRLVIFDARTPHAGRPPINTNNRCVINFNFANQPKDKNAT